MSTVTPRRYRVTVALPRPAGDGALVPPAAQVLAEATAAAVAAEDLMTAWTAGTTLLSMTVGSQCQPDALSAGWAVAGAWRHRRLDREGRAGIRAPRCGPGD